MAEPEDPNVNSNQSDESDDTQRGFGTTIRIYWTLITNVTLGILAVGISNRHSGVNSLDVFLSDYGRASYRSAVLRYKILYRLFR